MLAVRPGRAPEHGLVSRLPVRLSSLVVRAFAPSAERSGPILVGALSFAYFISFPLAIGSADESHLLYGAKRILQGEVIYKDFFEAITPLSFYLFAGLYRIAGTTLLTARVGMAVINAFGCALLFHLVRRMSGVLEGTLVVLIFAGICVPTWPYASAHWISTTLSLLVASVTLHEPWQRSTRARPLAAGMLAAVALCVQQQRGVFLAAWLPLALWVLARSHPRGRRWRTLGREIVWAGAGGAIVTLVILGHAAWASSPAAMVDALYRYPVTSYGPKFGGNFWGAVFPLTQVWAASTWLWLVRISPLFLLGEPLLLLRRGSRPRDRRDLERVCLWLLGVLMALSIWYLPDFIHVSFVLPFLLIPGASLLHRLRTSPVWSRVPGGRAAVAVGMWALGLAIAGKGAANLAYAHAVAPARFETGFGSLRGTEEMARLFRAVRRHLVREPDGRTLLYSYPDDAWLYLALPADDATRFSILAEGYFPPEFIQEMFGALDVRRPGTIVLRLPFSTESVRRAIEKGYDAVEETGQHRIYVRRET